MGKRKSRSELEVDLKSLRKSRLMEGLVSITNSLIKWGAIVLLARYIYLSIDALAGNTTLADIGISFLGEVEVSVTIIVVTAVISVIYGFLQKKLRKDTVEKLQTRIIELELKIDPSRSTSNLTTRGDSRPEDIL
ncbi:MAG: hypothetical protein GXP21_06660 [Gammaproteobacteria bacterium]|nr:hypothetical protein [Gammaproteobacteria bacterium]